MARINTTEAIPFPLAKPNADTPVTEAENIGYGNSNVKLALDSALSAKGGMSALKGYVLLDIGGFGLDGSLNSNTNRARLISSNIGKISLNGQSGLAYAVFGNNDGIGNIVTAVSDGWITEDFTNNTEYLYLFVMVKKTPSGNDFASSPCLYVEFTTYDNVLPVIDNVEDSIFPPSSKAVYDAFKQKGGGYDISLLNLTNGNPKTYATLVNALLDLPTDLRAGGISVRFIDSVSGKYVQYKLLSTSWSTIKYDWQSVSDIPMVGDVNLITSDGCDSEFFPVTKKANKGYVFCKLGVSFDTNGHIYAIESRAFYFNKGIDKIKIESAGYEFIVFGNDEGINSPVTLVQTWGTSEFVNESEYDYLFIMVRNSQNNNTVITESPVLYVEFEEPQSVFALEQTLTDNKTTSPSSKAVHDAIAGIGKRIDNIASLIAHIQGITYTDGFIKDDGEIQPSEGRWNHSSLFDVIEGEHITVNAYCGTTVKVIYFYNSSNEIIDSISGYGSEQHIYDITIPSNAVKAAVNGLVANGNILDVYRKKDLDNKTMLVEKELDLSNQLSFRNGFYLASNGAWKASNNWRTSNPVDCGNNVLSITANLASTNTVLAITYWDETDRIMLDESVVINNMDGQTVTSIKPTNAKKFAITSYTANSFPILAKVKIYTQQSYLEDDLDIREWEENVVSYTTNDQKYLNNKGEEKNISASFFVSSFIDASNIKAVKFCGRQGDIICNVAWYSAANESAVMSSPVGTPSGGNGIVAIYEKPTGATYLRICAKYDVFYNFFFDIKKKLNADIQERLLNTKPLNRLKRMSLIVIYGQSLSAGADSTPISTTMQTNNQALMFKQGVKARVAASELTTLVSLIEQSTETPASGLAEGFVNCVRIGNNIDTENDIWSKHQMIFSVPGVGGATIDELTDNSYYQYVENVITAAKTYCDNHGYELDIPLWCWLQGEQDTKYSMSKSDYKTKLLAIHDKFCNSVAAIAGISTRPKCVLYQPSCQGLYRTGTIGSDDQFDFSYDHMGVCNAFVELVRDNNDFIASVPTYILDPGPTTAGYWVHCNGISYKILGAMLGCAIKKYLIDGVKNKGVVPTDISVDGNNIKIKYNVPCPPLTFDTCYVKEVSNMGFSVVKSDNSDIVTKVSLFNDTITIQCSESPVGCKLRYGLNGDFIVLDNPPYNYTGIDGREHGARGNLRDSQGNYEYFDVENQRIPLHNWAYSFEILIS